MPDHTFRILRWSGALVPLLGECSGPVTAPARAAPTEAITVSPGLQPLLRWTPGGPVHAVTVAVQGSGAILWSATSPGTENALVPPVGYGTTPAGTISTANVVLFLPAGTRYQVRLSRYDSTGAVTIAGTTAFTP